MSALGRTIHMDIIKIGFTIILLLSAPRVRADGEGTRPAIVVEIVPTDSIAGSDPTIGIDNTDEHFHVVVTNVSKESVRLWKDWCSWGFQNLSLWRAIRMGER
jgi:hypothetical protein